MFFKTCTLPRMKYKLLHICIDDLFLEKWADSTEIQVRASVAGGRFIPSPSAHVKEMPSRLKRRVSQSPPRPEPVLRGPNLRLFPPGEKCPSPTISAQMW